ncbi:Uncharacterised protein [Mycobacteroides abscessus subsp. abscessus]|nr:Uncharacterised protein [Mycobacteroides abscessus subsp. abscessus]
MMLAITGGGTGVGHQLHAEGRLKEMRGLRRIAHDPPNRVPALDRERVGVGVVVHQPHELPQLFTVEPGQQLFVGQCVLDGHIAASPKRWDVGDAVKNGVLLISGRARWRRNLGIPSSTIWL